MIIRLKKFVLSFIISFVLIFSIPFYQLIKTGKYKKKNRMNIVKVKTKAKLNPKKEKRPEKKIKKIKMKSRSLKQSMQSMGRFALDLSVSSAAKNAVMTSVSDKKNTYKDWEVDVRASERRIILPEYPKEAQEKEIEGRVLLEITVSEQGNVNSAIIIEEKPQGLGFGQSALNSVRQWQFEPASIEGIPVRYTFRRYIDFKLE